MSARLTCILVTIAAMTLPSAASAWNVLKNPDFTGGITPWTSQTSNAGFVGWESSSGSPAGGSLRLESFDSNDVSHAEQCVDIHQYSVIDFSLRQFNDAEGGTGTHPWKLDVYDAADCAGNVLSTIALPLAGTDVGGGWIEVSTLGTPLPSGAISAKVNLDTLGGPGGFSYYLVDDVQVVPPDEIFPDSFEGG